MLDKKVDHGPNIALDAYTQGFFVGRETEIVEEIEDHVAVVVAGCDTEGKVIFCGRVSAVGDEELGKAEVVQLGGLDEGVSFGFGG